MAYRRNKLRTAFEIVRQIKNWPAAWTLRIKRQQPGLRLLQFRNGLNVFCRGGTRDWDVVHELLFARSYGRALEYLSTVKGKTTVVDLGGNIGLFSLLAAKANATATIHIFEPGPPNLRLLEMNCLANPEYGERVNIHPEGVGGITRTMKWYFDEANPGGSSLFSDGNGGTEVNIRSFADVIASIPDEISLVKIDIEGAEFEILKQTPVEIWQRVPAVSLELHTDPDKAMSNEQFLRQMESFGYRIESETVCSFFLKRNSRCV